MRPTDRRLLCALFFAFLQACGNGPDESRPIEILFFAQGPENTPFELEREGNDPECLAFSTGLEPQLVPSAGRGIQSQDAEHLFPNTFLAPYFFILENERQPVRGVFRNLSATDTLNVQRVLFGGDLLTNQELAPQTCRSLTTFTDSEEAVAAPPTPTGRMVRVDVCGFERNTTLPEGFRCSDAPALGGSSDLIDAHAVFLASIGDLESTYRTRCLQPQGGSRVDCQTPATLFLNNPQDAVSVVVSPLDQQTPRLLHIDLYLDGQFSDSDSGTSDVIVTEDL